MTTSGADQATEAVDVLTERDLYKVLGVPRGAKLDDIKKAYKKLSLRYHPDKNAGDPDAKLKFQKIAEAFSVLSDSKKRLKYDKSGDTDLEDFDMDQFMNMWVGEMMEEGGVVDDMMKEVLPWADDEDKMRQFMKEKAQSTGKRILCTICGHEASNKRLMAVHFEKKHQWDCDQWAQDTIKSMKDSFESFMKQITGIGDDSGTFVLPDGSTADMSNVRGVPDIRQHMQQRVDKAKETDAVMEMYRKVAGSTDGTTCDEDAQSVHPSVGTKDVEAAPDYTPDPGEIVKLLHVSFEEAMKLQSDWRALLRLLRQRIDELNEEEDEEMTLQGSGFEDGFHAFGGLEAMAAGFDILPGEDFLSGLDPSDLAALQGILECRELIGPPAGSAKGPRCRGAAAGAAGRRSAEPELETELGCKCGYSCGTLKALERHLEKFRGDPKHEGKISGGGPKPVMPAAAEEAAATANTRRVAIGQGDDDDQFSELGCTCGYTCGTEKALQRHLDKFPGHPSHARKRGNH